MIKNALSALEALSWGYATLLFIGLFILVAIVGILVVRDQSNPKHLKAHHDVTGFIFANIGVLYSVLLGFTVVNAQQHFDKMNENSKLEAANILELYRDTVTFSKKDQVAIRKALLTYGTSILEEEWNHLPKGVPHQNTSKQFNALWDAYYDVEIVSRKQEILYAQSIQKLNDLMTFRLSRIVGSEESLGDEMWAFLIFGALVILAFICFFAFENLWLHLLLASTLAATTAFLLFLIYALDSSFTGPVSVKPEALKKVLTTITSD